MARAPSLAAVRRAFAEEVRMVGHVSDDRVVEAFATVPREPFVAPGPWRIRSAYEGNYWTTPDADVRHIYHDVLIALDESRGLNTGQPSLWAHHFDRIDVRPGDRVLQIGTGSGYFTAILSELVGRTGTVLGFEVDPTLAELAAGNLEPWPQASVRKTGGRPEIEGQWDVIVAFAGATAPPASWVESLTPGGRALIPMTDQNWWGFLLRIDRTATGLAARSAGRVGFFHGQGLRSDDEAMALSKALMNPVGQSALKSLRRDPHDPDDTCWLHGAGWCLSKRELH